MIVYENTNERSNTNNGMSRVVVIFVGFLRDLVNPKQNFSFSFILIQDQLIIIEVSSSFNRIV